MQIAGLGTRGTGTCGTGTAGLGQVLQGQRDWDMRYKDSGTGTCTTGTFCLCFFVIRMLKENFSLRLYVIIVVTNTTVESLR